jgi:ATP-dependent DNA helicase RecG
LDENELAALVERIRRTKYEKQTLEVKSAHNGAPERLYDTLSAFSNQDSGGTIVFGIAEQKNYELVGVYDAQRLAARIGEQCKQMTPIVRAVITVAEIDGRTVVSAEIPGIEFSERPCFYNGAGRIRGSYTRVGGSDEPMTEYEVYSLDAYRKRIKEDMRIVDGVTLKDLDDNKLARLILAVKADKPQLARLPDTEIAERIGIIKNGKPTLTGLLTVGVYPQGLMPQLSVTAVVVPGVEVGETGADGERFTANKRFCGTIGEMLDEARLFVARNMKVKTIITEGKRLDKEEYPLNSVREVILNALMHRDYGIRTEGIPVRLLMYNDRMEVISPGGLYGQLTVDTLGNGRADTRNPTVAATLEALGLAENRFSGIPTVRREFKDAGLPEPKFQNARDRFIVTFYNGQNIQTEIKSAQITAPTVPLFATDEEKILTFCNTPRTRAEIADLVSKTQYYTVKTFIEPLIAKGLLKLTIPSAPKSKNQRYIRGLL